MRKGSTRFPDATRQSGGGTIGISHKPSKKLKTMSSVTRMDKLSKKRLDDNLPVINLASVPRKLRSVPSVVTSKRYFDQSTQNLTNLVSNKKAKLDSSITISEEEAIAGLLALAGNDNIRETKLNDKIHDLNESRNTLDVKKDCKDLKGGYESRKRCSSHIYICQTIKKLKIPKGETVIARTEEKTETHPENVKNVSVGINLNEAIIQDQPSGFGAHSFFGNPNCDPSQWPKPVFTKQRMRMTPFMSKPVQSGSYLQPSLHNVQVSKYRRLGYDENGVMFRVDSSPTLKLALQ